MAHSLLRMEGAPAASVLEPPFEVLTCSWPRPVVQTAERQWTSEPEWDAPLMPNVPRPHVELLDGEMCWTIDWRDFFRSDLHLGDRSLSGQMRGFHVVFRIRIKHGGWLTFWDDDGSCIRRNGIIIHQDRSAHPRQRSTIQVRVGDLLDIAQWQASWDWLWSARIHESEWTSGPTLQELLAPFRAAAISRLSMPCGPPLKMFTNAASPVRAILTIYSAVLNGYAPPSIHLFGDHQWTPPTRDLLQWALPFAEVHSTDSVLHELRTLGPGGLAELARHYWFVMKTCVGVLCAPREACMVDDDVVVLDSTQDALQAFQEHDLVFASDHDHAQGYLSTWRASALARTAVPFATSRFNAGLYWTRPVHDATILARQMLTARPDPRVPFFWEQGFIALMYAAHRAFELPSQRYFYPLFDGLPGGVVDYDYAANPCRFASVHFGGLSSKPNDGTALQLLMPILGRSLESAC